MLPYLVCTVLWESIRINSSIFRVCKDCSGFWCISQKNSIFLGIWWKGLEYTLSRLKLLISIYIDDILERFSVWISDATSRHLLNASRDGDPTWIWGEFNLFWDPQQQHKRDPLLGLHSWDCYLLPATAGACEGLMLTVYRIHALLI